MNSAFSRAVFQKRVRWGCRSTACKMRRILRGLTASMMPSATAWRAKSALDQCVMCRPRATGSRQASWMIWARCRGAENRRLQNVLAAVTQEEVISFEDPAAELDGPHLR